LRNGNCPNKVDRTINPPSRSCTSADVTNACSNNPSVSTRTWTGLTFGLLAAFDVERVVDFLQRAVVAPQTKVVVHRAARRQILRDVAPLAVGAQDIHHAVDHLAHVDAPLAAAALGRRHQRFDMRPLGVGQVARIAQLVAVVAGAVLDRPHAAPRESVPCTESQKFKPVQAAIPENDNHLI